MCRFVAYLGTEVLLQDILVKPFNSIIMQSIHARESDIPLNGDGFGLGWYAPSISAEPALFTSIFPAWNDRNLLHLTAKIKASCFFAHVRAAGNGGVTNYNCHPFVRGAWMLMHNGDISNFVQVKRHIRHLLDDDIYSWIKGETDSEHLFALFLQLAKDKNLNDLSIIANVLQTVLKELNHLVEYYAGRDASYYNICLTDGKRIVASRYCTEKNKVPKTLHYFTGHCFSKHLPAHGNQHEAAVISSEILTDFKADWQDVPVNSLLLINTDLAIDVWPLI